MNFVTSVFKKYINKNTGSQQGLEETPTNIVQFEDEKSRPPLSAETGSFPSDKPKQNGTTSNDEEETFQDAETSSTIYNNIRLNEDGNIEENPAVFQDNHPGQRTPIKTTAITDDNSREKNHQPLEYQMTKNDGPNKIPIKPENEKMLNQTINATEPDSLDNSMIDSLELAESRVLPARALIDSIETGGDLELEEYESLSQMATDSIENLTTLTEVVKTNSKRKAVQNSNIELNERFDEAGKAKHEQQISNDVTDNITKSNENVFNNSKPVSLNDILLNPPIKSSTQSPSFSEVDLEYENEPETNSALKELIKHVNESLVNTGAAVDGLDRIPANASSQLLTSENTININEENQHSSIEIKVDAKIGILEEHLQVVEAGIVKTQLDKNDSRTDSLAEVGSHTIGNLSDEFNKNGKNSEDDANGELSTEAQKIVKRDTWDGQKEKEVGLDSSDHKLILVGDTIVLENDSIEKDPKFITEIILLENNHPKEVKMQENKGLKDLKSSQAAVNIGQNVIKELGHNTIENSSITIEQGCIKECTDPNNDVRIKDISTVDSRVIENANDQKENADEPTNEKNPAHKTEEFCIDKAAIEKSSKDKFHEMEIKESAQPENLQCSVIERHRKILIHNNEDIRDNNQYFVNTKPENIDACDLNAEQPCESLAESIRGKNEELDSSQTKEIGNNIFETRQTLNSKLLPTDDNQNESGQVDSIIQTGGEKSEAGHEKKIAAQEDTNDKTPFSEIIENNSNSIKDYNALRNSGETDVIHNKTDQNHNTKFNQQDATKIENAGSEYRDGLETCTRTRTENMLQEFSLDHNSITEKLGAESTEETSNDRQDTSKIEMFDVKCTKYVEQIVEDDYKTEDKLKPNEQFRNQETDNIDISEKEKVIGEECNRIFERQDTQEFEILERQCSERNKMKTEGTLDDLIVKSSIKEKVEQQDKTAIDDYSRAFSRQDTKEFEILERQCNEKGTTKVEVVLEELVKENNRNDNLDQKEKSEPENSHKAFNAEATQGSENIECQFIKGKDKGNEDIILIGLFPDNHNINGTKQNENKTEENCDRVFERQDTREFEILEKQCKETNQIKTEQVLTVLVSENNINKDHRQTVTNIVGSKPKTEHTKILNKQESDLMGKQFVESSGVPNVIIDTDIIKNLPVYGQAQQTKQPSSELTKNAVKTKDNKKTETLEENQIITQNGMQVNYSPGKVIEVENKAAFDRQDTEELENLEMKLKNTNLIVDNILEELINQSTSSIRTNITKAASQSKEEKQEINKAPDKQNPQVFEELGVQHKVNRENSEEKLSKDSSASLEAKLNSLNIKEDTNKSTNICKTTVKKIITPNDISLISKDDIRQNKSIIPDTSWNQDMYGDKTETQVTENKFECRSEKTQENIDRIKQNYDFEKQIGNMSRSSNVPEKHVKEMAQENIAESRLNIRNQQSNAKSISKVVEDEHLQESISLNTNLEVISKNECKSRNDALKSKVDLLQQELASIRKANRRKEQVIVASTQNKEDDKAAVIKYRHLLQEYEKSILNQTKEIEKMKMESEENIRNFTNTEMAFSDVFEKYEKTKNVIAAYRRNEEVLLENIRNAEEQLSQVETKCFSMKQQSLDQIKRAQKQLENEKLKYKQDVAKLQAQVKRLEIKASSLEFALKQKSDECQALAALCDDITGRNSRPNT